MKKTYLITIFIFTAAIIAGFFILKKSKISYLLGGHTIYANDLVLNNIHLDGDNSVYSLKDGEVLRNDVKLNHWYNFIERDRVLKLAYFYQWLKEDPLLFDPNLDADSFDQAVLRLKQQNDQWVQASEYGYMHPIIFLQSFSQSSRQYQKFSQDISESSARQMLAALQNSQQAYASEVGRIGKSFHETNAQGYGDNTLLFLGGDTSSSIKIMSQDFDTMQKNADQLNLEVQKRVNCFEKMDCERPIFSFEKPTTVQKSTDQIAILPPEQRWIGDDIQTESGPFLVHTSCWQGKNENLLFEAKKCDGTPYCLDWPYISDGEYWDKTYDSNPPEKPFKDQGVERRTQSPSAPYDCMDLSYKPTLRTMNFAVETYAGNRLFSEKLPIVQDSNAQKELETIWNEGKQFEQNFFDASYPSDDALASLANYYLYTYGFLSQKNIAYVSKDEFLLRANILKGELQNFAFVMDRSTYHFQRNMKQDARNLNIPQNKENIHEYYYVHNVLTRRSNYSIMFLNFSSFVWRIAEKPQYFLAVGKNATMKSMNEEDIPEIDNDAAIKIYGIDKLKDWAAVSKEIHSDNF